MKRQDKPKRLFSFPLEDGANPAQLFASHAAKPYSLFFDSNRAGHPLNRYSYLCIDPFETIVSQNGQVTVTNKNNRYNYAADPFTVVRERLKHYGDIGKTDRNLPPFTGGAAGFFGYDLVRQIEDIPSRKENDRMPDMCIGLYDAIAAFDHLTQKAWVIVLADDRNSARNRAEIFNRKSDHLPSFFCSPLTWNSEKNDRQYLTDIRKSIDYIFSGDIFQVNLSRRFTAQIPDGFDRYAHYLHLRQVNAAPFSTYMNFGDLILSGTSPERFLFLQNKRVETRPIKGTLSSHRPAFDLENSDKDRAENAMIVDLMRNDLSKVCEDHSVEVERLCAIETFEGLHHMVSTVSGTLRADQSAMDLLRACFPGGSVTGAPKIRAMEIIEELEPNRRGPYCGAAGFIGWDDTMDMNILIRTLVYAEDAVHLQTGGGITAKSDPDMELQETLVKANRLFASFHAANKTVKIA